MYLIMPLGVTRENSKFIKYELINAEPVQKVALKNWIQNLCKWLETYSVLFCYQATLL